MCTCLAPLHFQFMLLLKWNEACLVYFKSSLSSISVRVASMCFVCMMVVQAFETVNYPTFHLPSSVIEQISFHRFLNPGNLQKPLKT